jgi:N-acetylglucosamine-6-phosphate deacetylase
VAPGFLDLQVNGLNGVHFTTLELRTAHEKLAACARMQASAGVTAWWATLPTVPPRRWGEVLPLLGPRAFGGDDESGGGATLLGAHCEGPFLCREKKGAHCEEFMLEFCGGGLDEVYGDGWERVVRMVTLAPEVAGGMELIRELRARCPGVRIAVGHSAAGFDVARRAVAEGVCMVTHTFNAMNGVTGREPGVPGLMEREAVGLGEKVWFSVIGDGVHLSDHVLRMAVELGLDGDDGGGRCIGITDAIELAGLPDGIYEGNQQIVGRQVKIGNRATIEGKGTLIGSCVLVDHVVRQIAGVHEGGARAWSGLDPELKEKRLVRAVKCVSQNVADMMGESSRGRLDVGMNADFVVLNPDAYALQTWIGGRLAYESSGSLMLGMATIRDELDTKGLVC